MIPHHHITNGSFLSIDITCQSPYYKKLRVDVHFGINDAFKEIGSQTGCQVRYMTMNAEHIAESSTKENEQRKDVAAASPLEDEVSRAIEMMKRVKTAAAAQSVIAPEDQRMPSLFVPQPLILCVC
jgi:hypothetical protein